jgi:hypothetical protein
VSDAFDKVMPTGRGRCADQPSAPHDALTSARRAAAELTDSAARMTHDDRVEACEHTVGPF